MKKIILIALLISATTTGWAQSSKWGVKAGLNYNLAEMGIENAYNSVGDIVEGHQANNGWHLGLLNRTFFNESFFVQFEGLFSQTSNEITGTNIIDGVPVTFNNEFYNLVGQFNIIGGFEFFRFVRAQGGLTGKLVLNDDYASTFGNTSVGYTIGAGINLGRLNFDITYNSSFKNHEGEWNNIPLSFDDSELLFSLTYLLKK